MRGMLKARIALRYLTARKSHSAVTAISVVALVGVCVATAAMICVLSVFNGFRRELTTRLDSISPDVCVTPAAGKTIASSDSVAARLRMLPEVAVAMPVVSDNALLLAGTQEFPVTLKGVSKASYDSIVNLRELIVTGNDYVLETPSSEPKMYYDADFEEWMELDDTNDYSAAIAVGVASRIGGNLNGSRLLLFAPRRRGRVNPANPVSSFLRDSVAVSAVWQAQQPDYDKDMVITDIRVARRLFQYDDEATSIEIAGAKGVDGTRVTKAVEEALGDGFVVRDRLMQQQTSFRMINIEKWVTFLLLAFILLIASFNIISTLSMLVLDKEEAMRTLRSLGATRRDVGDIFAWESCWVTLFGTLGGLGLGLLLCFLQERFGLIHLAGDPETLLISVYPVQVQAFDLLVVAAPAAVIGVVTAIVTATFARNRLEVSAGY